MNSDDLRDTLRAANDTFVAGMEATSNIPDRHQEAAQRDIALAALDKLHSRLHTHVDDAGVGTLRKIIEDARYGIAEIGLTLPKVPR